MKRILALTLVLAGTAGTADAAQYVQHVCRVAGGPADTDGLLVTAAEAGFADTCLSGGELRAALSTGRTASFVEILYRAPIDTRIAGVTLDRTAERIGSTYATYTLSGTPDQCIEFSCYGLNGTVNYQDLDLPETTFRLACPETRSCDPNGTATLTVRSMDIRLRDDFAPVVNVAFPTTELSGVVQIPFDAADRGGGVFQSELVVDGVARSRESVDGNDGACAIPFTKRVPCKLSTSGISTFDTTSLPNGNHTIALNVYDATGENVTSAGPVTVSVRNAGSAAGPAAAGARVVGFRPRRDVRTAFARPVVLRGRLLDNAGAALAGAEVGAYAALDVPGAKSKLVAKATTGPDGAFRIVVPSGPSRRIVVRPVSGTGAQAWSLRTRVRAPIALMPSRKRLRNGDKLLLTAYLVGTKPPAGSADVAFQVRIGKRWRTFARTAFDKRGLAQIEHRFRVTFQRITYRFRALTLKRKRFPFEDSRSRVVSVRVN